MKVREWCVAAPHQEYAMSKKEEFELGASSRCYRVELSSMSCREYDICNEDVEDEETESEEQPDAAPRRIFRAPAPPKMPAGRRRRGTPATTTRTGPKPARVTEKTAARGTGRRMQNRSNRPRTANGTPLDGPVTRSSG
ncbi:unnamed protein product [Gongylonema pulchrum]|uniref:Uncharacterized protein n=1 Tax=Gongylonema pulchrum TaxID=637853 RepID=A0A183E6E6_9BILA|nr:unnamed protein product [Gongylonema pulchrum]